MSLKVYLRLPDAQYHVKARIFIREDGANKEISRAEWDVRFPGCEPDTVPATESDCVYSANITHNLFWMATEAGIYQALWQPEEIGITHAEQVIAPLRDGLELLKSEPDRFRKFNPESGWGTYESLIDFVADYLAACEMHPTAEVSVLH